MTASRRGTAPLRGASVTYAEGWNPHIGRITRPLDEKTARDRHGSGTLYTVVLGRVERPRAVVDVRLEVPFVGVQFLDEKLRPHLDYVFAEPKEAARDGWLFLSQAIERKYDRAGNVTWGALHVFHPSGLVEVEEKDYVKQEVERYNVQRDASDNWEPAPEFGRYDSVARTERDRRA